MERVKYEREKSVINVIVLPTKFKLAQYSLINQLIKVRHCCRTTYTDFPYNKFYLGIWMTKKIVDEVLGRVYIL